MILDECVVAGLPTELMFFKEWLPSDMFYFRRIDADSVASPNLPHSPVDLKFYGVHQAEQLLKMHVVVDVNVHNVGRTPNMEFVPDVIVVSGAPVFRRVMERGNHGGITAYVGNRVQGEFTV